MRRQERLLFGLDRRSSTPEWMDDFSVCDERLTHALADLAVINQCLGGHLTSIRALESVIPNDEETVSTSLLDIGCGGGDFAQSVASWAERRSAVPPIRIVAIDLNSATVGWAENRTGARLSGQSKTKVQFKVADAFSLPFANKSFDFAHASLFLHHFDAASSVNLLREMERVTRRVIIVNDLHRHVLALLGIKALTCAANASAMVRHDGPLSVRRAFTRDELTRIASAAAIGPFNITWHWAFRWLLTIECKDV